MNRLLMFIPRLRFNVNFQNPNPTVYKMRKPETAIMSGHKSRQLFSRKMFNEMNKSDVFVTKNIETKPVNNVAEANITTKVKAPRKPHGRYSKEDLAKYFDNDNPRRDYFMELVEDSEKALQAQNKSYREVKNADSIREFVETKRVNNPIYMNYNGAHGFDMEELEQNYLRTSR